MKAEELILDQYYVADYNNTGDKYLFKNVYTEDGKKSCQPYIRLSSNQFSMGLLNGLFNQSFSTCKYQKATPKQIAHLNACIQANGFVTCPTDIIINHYEIY